MARITLKDIARELSLSPSTVSRALRNHPDISDTTKEKVSQTAKRLDYYPDTLAQGLKSRNTNTIGIIVPEIRHDFFSSAISGIEEVAYSSGFAIMVCQSSENYEREVINLRTLVSNQIAGLLVSLSQTTFDISHFDILKKRNIPVVFFDRTHKDITDSQVIVDDYDGAVKMVNFLLDKGYKKIAHIAGPEHISISAERLRGYKDALQGRGIKIDDNFIIKSGFREEDGVKAIEQILKLKNRPDAIFAVNDPVAIGVFSVLKREKIKIPEEMALVGFCNNPISALIEPAITTIQQPAHLIGKAAAKLLIDRITDPDNHSEPVKMVLKTEIIVRNSA